MCILKKKYYRKKGSVLKLLPVLLGMTAITVLSLMYLYYTRDMDVREQASQVIREYMLDMEAEGYLTEQSERELVKRLNELGLEYISLSGSTMTDAGYGNEIVLSVNAVIKLSRFGVDNLFEPDIDSEYENFSCIRKSTAKN